MKKVKLTDDTSVAVDHQGFVFFEIDDGEDDSPFECGGIGLGYLIDAVEEALGNSNHNGQSYILENNPLVEVSIFDSDICITNNEDENWWEVVASGNIFLSTLKGLVIKEIGRASCRERV